MELYINGKGIFQPKINILATFTHFPLMIQNRVQDTVSYTMKIDGDYNRQSPKQTIKVVNLSNSAKS